MNENSTINTKWIVSKREKKNTVNPQKPYAWLIEKEHSPFGKIEDVGIIYLTNRESPFHCLMCDLWKNNTDKTMPISAIPKQKKWP